MALITGTSGDDWLEVRVTPGLRGTDVDGGNGIDMVVIDASLSPEGVVFSLAADSSAINTLPDGARISHVETVWLYGSNEAANLVVGGRFGDVLYGGIGDDTLIGGGGSDLITGATGGNYLAGGAGNDYIVGGPEAEYISGEAGNDYIQSNGGRDTLLGGTGFDSVFIDASDSPHGINFSTLANLSGVVALESGIVVGGMERVVLYGSNTAADNLTGGRARDALTGGGGDDTLKGGARSDSLRGGAGNDLVDGGEGDDVLTGDTGRDTLQGGAGNDDISYDFGRSGVVDGGDGDNDTLLISFRDLLNDTAVRFDVEAATGADGVLRWNDGSEVRGVENFWIFGSDHSSNMLATGPGNDTLRGGYADDMISGGAGNDLIGGSLGEDTLIGGAGTDRFFLYAPTNAFIADFESGSDTIAIYYREFRVPEGQLNGTLPTSQFCAGSDVTSAADANDHFLYNTTTGILYYDRDGTGSTPPLQLAALAGQPVLTAEDISIVGWLI